jgi:hypothetical protein
MHTLSHVLRCAPACNHEEIVLFLDRIATEDWLDDQVSNRATVGGLAGSLYSLANALPEDLKNRFLRPALRMRIVKELGAYSPDTESWANLFSFLGAARALGLRTEWTAADWPSEPDIAAILEQRAPPPDATVIGPLQIQLWLGLREMARLRNDAISVPAEHAERVLALWHAHLDPPDEQLFPTDREGCPFGQGLAGGKLNDCEPLSNL